LGDVAAKALTQDKPTDEPPTQVLVDLAAALDPNAGGVAGSTAVAVTATSSGLAGPASFALAQPIVHHDSCPGNYIVGQVFDASGTPKAGVHIVLVDEWGNRADAVSKEGAGDYGSYDFPLNAFANRYTLTVVDEAGAAISQAVVVEHLQGDGGAAPCHTVIWQGRQ
jgi:hypothetical protein